MPETPQEPKEINFPEWNQLSEGERDLLTRHIIQAKRWKFGLFAVLTLTMGLNPLLSSWFANKSEEGKIEAMKIEKLTESTKTFNESILASLVEAQKKIAILEKEKEELKVKIANLEAQLLE